MFDSLSGLLRHDANRSNTIGSILRKNKGIGPGFDFLRLFLSVAILIDHAYGIAAGKNLPAAIFTPLAYCILPIFFSLSGFLVTGSALRTQSFRVFMTFRILRIVPALATEVALSAIIIGPIATTMSLSSYFSDLGFYKYFGNIIGKVDLSLPGVFETQVGQPGIVNYNLWTLAPEFYCYAIMAILLLTRNVRRNPILLINCIFTIGVLTLSVFNLYDSINGHLRWHLLVYSFVAGSFINIYKEVIPCNYVFCSISAVFAFVILQLNASVIAPLSVPLLSYIAVCLGMINIPIFDRLRREDYSYGIYLYGYPLTASWGFFCPAVRNVWLLPIVSLLSTIVFAAASWHIIEKPCLRLRKRFLEPRKIINRDDIVMADKPES